MILINKGRFAVSCMYIVFCCFRVSYGPDSDVTLLSKCMYIPITCSRILTLFYIILFAALAGGLILLFLITLLYLVIRCHSSNYEYEPIKDEGQLQSRLSIRGKSTLINTSTENRQNIKK